MVQPISMLVTALVMRDIRRCATKVQFAQSICMFEACMQTVVGCPVSSTPHCHPRRIPLRLI